MKYVMVPGIGNSGPSHWHSHWEDELGGEVSRIAPTSWDSPDETDWMAAISEQVAPGAVVVAHSLGCLAATAWVARHGATALGGLFLVAPPDQAGPQFPAAASSFRTVAEAMPVASLVVASTDDPYDPSMVASRLARRWGAGLVVAGALGHINESSGAGRWQQGRDLLAAFTAGLHA